MTIASSDAELDRLLRAAGSPYDAAGIDALLRGIAAAPEPFPPDSWLDLVACDVPPALAELLRGRLAQLRARQDDETPLAGRLERLRQRLATLGLDGLVLQRTDEFGSEHLPAAAERVAWLTGFTGSAGQVVVLRDRAAVFVDGRYTAQLAQEVDPERFEACHLVERPPTQWLEQHLPRCAALGYDPMLTTTGERARLEKVVKGRDGRLVRVAGNPVDDLWRARPPAPIGAIRPHDERYAGEPSAAKRRRMAAAASAKGASWLVLTAPDSIAWLLNLRGGDIPYNPLALCFALLGEDATCRLFVDPRKLPAGHGLDNAITVEPQGRFLEALADLGAAGTRVMVDPATTHVAYLDRLREAGAVVIEANDPCVMAKACKNATELEGAVAAQRRDGAALARFLAWLDAQPLDGSLHELDAARRLEQERARDPLYRGPSFETISAHGPNGAVIHYRAMPGRDRPLTAGTLYLSDSGAQYLDATTDITRTVALGPPRGAMRRHYTLVLKGHIAIAEAVFPVGTTGAQLDTLARAALWRAGLDYDHGTGHGVGSYLCVHEGPARLSKTGGAVALAPGMILSNEPGCYRVGDYGIRIESLVVVRKAAAPEGAQRELLAFDTLSLCPLDRRLIATELLTEVERNWVDAYHARVAAELAPLLDEPARAWLAAACAPL
jgi:Xaa-Pro aminopeptidase